MESRPAAPTGSGLNQAISRSAASSPSKSRSSSRTEAAFELAFLICSCALLAVAGAPLAAALLALLALVNAALIRREETASADR